MSQWTAKDASPVPERVLDDWEMPEPIGYAESKYTAERLLDDARRVAGVNCAICRVGQIAGPVAQNGIWNRNEWLPSPIASSKYLGKLPASLGPLNLVDWIPVDLLSKIILDLLFNTSSELSDICQSSNGTCLQKSTVEPISTAVFHAVNSFMVSWTDLVPAVQTVMGETLKIVTLVEWVDILKSSLEGTKDIKPNPAVKLLDFFVALKQSSDQPRLDATTTTQKSPTMAALEPVSKFWMKQWGYCYVNMED